MINIDLWIGSLILATPALLCTQIFWDNEMEICLMDLPGPRSVYRYTLYQSLIAFFLPLRVITVFYSLTLQHLFCVMRRVHQKASACSQKLTCMVLTMFFLEVDLYIMENFQNTNST